jgi:hypothetical protein
MTKDNQLANAGVTIKYLCVQKSDDWFISRVKGPIERLVENHVAETFLYDVTTDRNAPKDLLKKMNEVVKDALKSAPKPPMSVKLEEVSLIIKRDR